MLNVLYFYVNTFRSMCALPYMGVFSSSVISCFPSMLLKYCLKDCEMVTVAPLLFLVSLFLPYAPYFYCKVFIFQNLLGFFLVHIFVS